MDVEIGEYVTTSYCFFNSFLQKYQSHESKVAFLEATDKTSIFIDSNFSPDSYIMHALIP